MFDAPQDDAESFRRLLKLEPSDPIPSKYLRYYQQLLYMAQQEGHTGPLGGIHVAHCLLSCGFKPELPDARPDSINWDRIKRGARLEVKADDEWLAGEFQFFGQHKTACVKLDRDGEVHEFYRHHCRVPQGVKPVEKPVEPEAEVLEPAMDWTKVEVNEEVYVDIAGDNFEGTFLRTANDGQIVVLVEGEEMTVDKSKVMQAAVA